MNDFIAERVLALAKTAEKRRARRVIALDLRELTTLCDYFLICHGQSRAHVRAIAQELQEYVKREKIPLLHVEGSHDTQWMIIDCGDVIVHVFGEEAREFYDLEGLWGDAPLTYEGSEEDSDSDDG